MDLKKYVRKFIDFDGSYGYQCVDLINQYMKDIGSKENTLGIEYAKDILDRKYKEWKLIEPKELQSGDIFVLNSGTYGHTGIVTERKLNGVKVIEQNVKPPYDGSKASGGVVEGSYLFSKIKGGLRFIGKETEVSKSTEAKTEKPKEENTNTKSTNEDKKVENKKVDKNEFKLLENMHKRLKPTLKGKVVGVLPKDAKIKFDPNFEMYKDGYIWYSYIENKKIYYVAYSTFDGKKKFLKKVG